LGFALGKLSSADLKTLASQFIDRSFNFLHEQGPVVSAAIIFCICVGSFGVWCINKLINGKQAEIERMVVERDKFQQPYIANWKSSKGKGGNKK